MKGYVLVKLLFRSSYFLPVAYLSRFLVQIFPSHFISNVHYRLRYCPDTTDSSQICFADRYHPVYQKEDGTEDRVAMREEGRGRERDELDEKEKERESANYCDVSVLPYPPVRCIKNATSFNGRISWRGSHCHSSSVFSYSGLRSLCTRLPSPRGSVGPISRAPTTTRFSRVSRLMTLFLVDAVPRHKTSLALISIFCWIMTDMCR